DGIRDFHVTGVQTCALPILFEQYFVKGNLQVEDLRALDLGTRPELNLLFQLAWHPSTDTNVWLEVLAYNCTEFDSFKLGYDRLRSEERRVGKECRTRRSREQ